MLNTIFLQGKDGTRKKITMKFRTAAKIEVDDFDKMATVFIKTESYNGAAGRYKNFMRAVEVVEEMNNAELTGHTSFTFPDA